MEDLQFIHYIVSSKSPAREIMEADPDKALTLIGKQSPRILLDLLSGRVRGMEAGVQIARERFGADALSRGGTNDPMLDLALLPKSRAGVYFLTNAISRVLQVAARKFGSPYCVAVQHPKHGMVCRDCAVEDVIRLHQEVRGLFRNQSPIYFKIETEDQRPDLDRTLYALCVSVGLGAQHLARAEPVWSGLTLFDAPQFCSCGEVLDVDLTIEGLRTTYSLVRKGSAGKEDSDEFAMARQLVRSYQGHFDEWRNLELPAHARNDINNIDDTMKDFE
jgi:hypothetical protein